MTIQRFVLIAALSLSCTLNAAEQPASKPSKLLTMADVIVAAKPADWRPLDLQNTLYMDLPAGRVIIELAPAFAPNHVQNIKALAREGYFDGLVVLRSQDNYVVQWGDPSDDEEADQSKAKPVRTAKRTLPGEFTVAISPDVPFTLLSDKDGYAPQTGFSNGFPSARDPKSGRAWLCHCYGTVGVGRGNEVDSGGGTSLYAVNGHAPRQLDRNITTVGRVVQGMELLSTLPRGRGKMGFYEKDQAMEPIKSVRVAADVPEAERTDLEVLRTDTATFTQLVETRRNRHDDWYKFQVGYVEVCNVPMVVRAVAKK